MQTESRSKRNQRRKKKSENKNFLRGDLDYYSLLYAHDTPRDEEESTGVQNRWDASYVTHSWYTSSSCARVLYSLEKLW